MRSVSSSIVDKVSVLETPKDKVYHEYLPPPLLYQLVVEAATFMNLGHEKGKFLDYCLTRVLQKLRLTFRGLPRRVFHLGDEEINTGFPRILNANLGVSLSKVTN